MKSATSTEKKELVVFAILRDSKCAECGAEVGRHSFLTMETGQPHCLECADLDHLQYLPRGNTALTRRAKKHSGLSAVVVEFSRSRGHYERQGILVEAAALETAEQECLADEDRRAAQRERAALTRDRADEKYAADFAEAIRDYY